LRLLALGHTNGEIAEQLFLSRRTIETHRASIQRKLDLSTRAELTRYAIEHKLLEA
jgi:two-component system, NarL family, response regulator NreC